MSIGEPITKKRLKDYIFLQLELENQHERLVQLESETVFPTRPEGSEGGGSGAPSHDRVEKRYIRMIEKAEKIRAKIADITKEMDEIDDAISALENPLEREVLRLRYTDGAIIEDEISESDIPQTVCRHMKWDDIAKKIYGSNDEKHVKAAHRLHGLALENIKKVTI